MCRKTSSPLDEIIVLPQDLSESYQATLLELAIIVKDLSSINLQLLLKTFNNIFTSKISVQETPDHFKLAEEKDCVAIHNISLLMSHVYKLMNQHAEEHKLSYHTFAHAIEVMLDVIAKIEQQSIHIEWLYLLACCALAHDVVFTRHRIIDEKNSANLLIELLKPLLVLIDDKDSKNIEKLIQLIIVAGTLPLVHIYPDEQELSIQPVWSFLFTQRAPCQLDRVCSIISASDMNRSATPEVLETFPEKADRATPLLEPLASSIQSSEAREAVIVTKIGQSARFILENLSQDALESKIKRCMDSDDSVYFEDEEIAQLIKLFQSEIGFLAMMEKGQRRSDLLAEELLRNREIWQSQTLVYENIIKTLETGEPRTKQNLLKNIFVIAQHQQGAYVDFSRVGEILNKQGCRLMEEASETVFRIAK